VNVVRKSHEPPRRRVVHTRVSLLRATTALIQYINTVTWRGSGRARKKRPSRACSPRTQRLPRRNTLLLRPAPIGRFSSSSAAAGDCRKRPRPRVRTAKRKTIRWRNTYTPVRHTRHDAAARRTRCGERPTRYQRVQFLTRRPPPDLVAWDFVLIAKGFFVGLLKKIIWFRSKLVFIFTYCSLKPFL